MNRFEIPMNLQCNICNNIAVHYCKAVNKKICRLCCDKYQLMHKPIDKCLKCNHLFRDVGYEVKFNMGVMFSNKYKNKFVFDNQIESYHMKVVELYERLGVNTIDEMYNLGINYYHANKAQKALHLYNEVIKRNIDNGNRMELYEDIGNALLSLDRIVEAKDAYIKSLDYGNTGSTIYRRLGEVYNILKEYSQSIYYHEKSLSIYLSYQWKDGDDWFRNVDGLYFANYCSLATGYSEFNDYDKVIENANAFLHYHGNFESIKERFFTKDNYIGDGFSSKLIVSMYKLISLAYIAIKDFSQAKDNIKKARVLSNQDVELAKIEGLIEGKLDSKEMILEVEKLRQELVEKNSAIMLLIKNTGNRTAINYNFSNIGGDVYMGSKYNVENGGTIGNQVFGDKVTFSNVTSINSEISLKEIDEILLEIGKKISVIGNENTQKHIDEINESIKNGNAK